LPIIARVAPDYRGRIKFVRLDFNKDWRLAMHVFQVRRVPVHVLLKTTGQIIHADASYMDETQFRAFLDRSTKE
jgi:thioredoxin-like negative regulator of GroEL